MKINKQSTHAVIYPFEDTSLHYDNEGGAYIYNYDGSLVLCVYEAEYGEDFWWTVFDANTYTVLDNMRFGLVGQSTLEKALQNFLKKSIYADEFDLKQRAARKIYKASSIKIADANEIEMVVDGKYCDGYAYVTTNDGGVTLDVEVDVECWGDNGEEVVNSFFSLSGKNSAQNLAIELGFYVESEYGDELGIDFDHLEQQFKDYFKTGSKSAFNKNADEFDLKQRVASRKRMADFRAEFVPHWDMDYYAIKYKIYQVRDSLLDYLAERDEHHPYVFMRWDFAKSHGFDFGDYWLAYEGEIRYVSEFENESKMLEHIFEKFNMNHPSDFYGRSLSVSDIVEINGRYFYCDSFGFTEIDPYAHAASRKTAEVSDTAINYPNPYQLLSRLQTDCEYVINSCGGERNLWAKSWQEHIETMRYLYDKCERFEGYPEWISEADIDAYEDAFRERFAFNKNATRHFTYAEMQELDDEIEGRELHNATRLRYTTGTELM